MDKKLTVKRIVIFSVLAIVISIVLSAMWDIIFLYLPDALTMYDDLENAASYSSLAGFSMLGPAIAAFLTRLITHEGMEHSMLKFNIKGNLKNYILPLAALLAVTIINALALPIITGQKLYFGNDIAENALIMINVIISAALLCGLYFGEEYGWRGYLFPKLDELVGTGKAIIITGIIWGVWHTPVLLQGHNFGKDVPFFPVSNILMMCVLCIFITPIFAYFTKKTDSVWPAVLAHGFVNNFAAMMTGMFTDPDSLESISQLQASSVMFIGFGIVGIFFFVLMTRKKESKR